MSNESSKETSYLACDLCTKNSFSHCTVQGTKHFDILGVHVWLNRKKIKLWPSPRRQWDKNTHIYIVVSIFDRCVFPCDSYITPWNLFAVGIISLIVAFSNQFTQSYKYSINMFLSAIPRQHTYVGPTLADGRMVGSTLALAAWRWPHVGPTLQIR